MHDREQAALEAAEARDLHRVGAALPRLAGARARAGCWGGGAAAARTAGAAAAAAAYCCWCAAGTAAAAAAPYCWAAAAAAGGRCCWRCGGCCGGRRLALRAAAQRVLARVEVLDLRLLVAVAGRRSWVCQGCGPLGPAAGRPGALGTGGMTAVGSAAPGPGRVVRARAGPVCGSTLVAAFGSYGARRRGAAAPGSGRPPAGPARRPPAGRRVGGEQRADAVARPRSAPELACTPMPAATARSPRARFSALGRSVRVLAQAALDDRPQRRRARWRGGAAPR